MNSIKNDNTASVFMLVVAAAAARTAEENLTATANKTSPGIASRPQRPGGISFCGR